MLTTTIKSDLILNDTGIGQMFLLPASLRMCST